MQTEIKKWGNSAVVRLPATMLSQLRLAVGSPIKITADGNRLIIEPSVTRRYSLEELLAEMPSEFPMVEGWDEMEPVGKEIL